MTGNRDLLIINQDSGYLMIDIANVFAESGFNVTLLAGRIVIRDNELKDSIRVQKVIRYNRKNNFSRICTWTIAFFQILFLLEFKYRKYDLLIVSNPPFTVFLPLFVANRYSLLIFDVFPDAISELGILNSESFLIKTWKKLNISVYQRADNIFTISEGMKNTIKKYADIQEIKVIPLWSGNNFLKPCPEYVNPFINRHGLKGKFVVMYSGNFGIYENLRIILEIADRTYKRRDVVFLMAGDGIMRKQITDQINKMRLQNCILLPWQNTHEMPYSFAASNLAIISLGKISSSVSIPSKFYDFLSVGSPILGLANLDSELSQLITRLNVGQCFDPSDLENIIQFIYFLADNKDKYNELHANSLKAACEYTRENARKIVLFWNSLS